MKFLFSLLGYVKIPTEVIMLMMSLSACIELIPNPVQREKGRKICRVMLEFLRSGRRLVN